jgi:glucosamine-6-phosphate deaminase
MTLHFGKTELRLCDSYEALGLVAADAVAACMRDLLARQREVRMIFAAAESQATFLEALATAPDIDWQRVVCFNMDEFWGPDVPYNCSCIYQLRRQLYDRVHPLDWHVPQYDAKDGDAEVARFATVFAAHKPIDILCQGIGRSGHLALNEPGVTSFTDPQDVRLLDVAEASLAQLRDDPNFRDAVAALGRGITLTIPALMSARHRFTMVPLATKRPILERVLACDGPTETLPATILYDYEGTLFMDRDSCPATILDAFSNPKRTTP